jgi:hypothetical protein
VKHTKEQLQNRLGQVRQELAKRQVLKDQRLMNGQVDSQHPIYYEFDVEELRNMEKLLLTTLFKDFDEDSGFDWEAVGYNVKAKEVTSDEQKENKGSDGSGS